MKPESTSFRENTCQRRVRRIRQPVVDRKNEERNRKKALRGGQPDQLGVLQGQNGEQGSRVDRRSQEHR